MQKLVTVVRTECVNCGGSSGPEIVPGDTVKLWLNTESIPNFPEWVEGTVTIVWPKNGTQRKYTIQYEVDDLDSAAAELRDCDIVSVTCVGCCVIINDYLRLMAGINVPHVSLAYEWNSDGTFTLKATAFSRQIAGVPGSQVTIASYVFRNPSDAVISAGVGETNARKVTPADTGETDWPGGEYSVLVTDSEGLAASASVWVAPKPRFRRKTVTILEGETTVQVTLTTGEEIVSITAKTTEFGFYQFGLLVSDPSTIESSASPTGDLPLSVLIHIP